MFVEKTYRLICGNAPFVDRNILLDDLVHPLFYPVDELLTHGVLPFHGKVDAFVDRKANHCFVQVLFSCGIKDGLQQYKGDSTFICAVAAAVCGSDEGYRTILVDPVEQLL